MAYNHNQVESHLQQRLPGPRQDYTANVPTPCTRCQQFNIVCSVQSGPDSILARFCQSCERNQQRCDVIERNATAKLENGVLLAKPACQTIGLPNFITTAHQERYSSLISRTQEVPVFVMALDFGTSNSGFVVNILNKAPTEEPLVFQDQIGDHRIPSEIGLYHTMGSYGELLAGKASRSDGGILEELKKTFQFFKVY